MAQVSRARELSAEECDAVVDAGNLHFQSTTELDALDELVGQPRAMSALDLGLGIKGAGYNVYVAGMHGMGKKEMIRRNLSLRVDDEPPACDWVYVNNFKQPDAPMAVNLETGQGVELQNDMNELVRRMRDELPKAFRQEDFSREKQRMGRKYEEKSREVLQQLEDIAKEKALVVQPQPDGQIIIIPLKPDGEAMTPDEFNAMTEEAKEEVGRRQQAMAEEAARLLSRRRDIGRQLSLDVREIEREFANNIIKPQIEDLKLKYRHSKLDLWFDSVRADMVENLSRFRQEEGQQHNAMLMMMGGAPQGEDDFTEYKVNVVVDNSHQERAPIVIEESPNYKNMFGTIGGVFDRTGKMTSDFMHIKAGSILRANGGYLVFNIMEALMEPLVWKELKRTIKSGSLEYHTYDPFGVFTASALRPEVIPVRVKLVVLGNPLIYHLLYLYDEDFREIFKVKADFSSDMPRDEESGMILGQFVEKLGSCERVLPFDAGAVVALERAAVRMAAHKTKVTTEFSRLADLIREASFWAEKDHASVVRDEHVQKAVDEKVYRSNLVAEKIRELIRDGSFLLSLDGVEVGQVNGLAVADLGDYAFGRPSRITASVGIGAAGITNIERESKLSGRTYDKAMLILDGYIRTKYAKDTVIALSGSIAMEQSYGMIDGDSASVAELLCLLSAVAHVPLRQDIAITGSVNQKGIVQAIGGVNEKIEGFFDVCKEHGLTGKQGVCIPESNVQNLVLHPDVLAAIRAGHFHVWTIETVDDAIHLMTEMEPGNVDNETSFHGVVARRLKDMAAALKEQPFLAGGGASAVLQAAPEGYPDPRPPLPGKDENPEVNNSNRGRDSRCEG